MTGIRWRTFLLFLALIFWANCQEDKHLDTEAPLAVQNEIGVKA